MTKTYMAPSVKKAFDILRLIGSSKTGLGTSEIARSLGISKGTVHGIVNALEESGAIIKDPSTKTHKLGFTIFELARGASMQMNIMDKARPVMEELSSKIHETVFLGVLNGDHYTLLDIIESSHNIKLTAPIGTRVPLLAAATGKAMLACLEDEKIVQIIKMEKLERFTENTITDPENFMNEIRKAREEKVATDYEEYIKGVRAIASPIRWGNQIFAITIVGFAENLKDDKMEYLKKSMIAAAEEISR